jgi:hypothetical protein
MGGALRKACWPDSSVHLQIVWVCSRLLDDEHLILSTIHSATVVDAQSMRFLTSFQADFVSDKSIVLDLHDCMQAFAALIGDLAAARLAPGRTLLFNSHHPHVAAWTQRSVPYTLVQFHRAILNRQCGAGVAVRWRGKEKKD